MKKKLKNFYHLLFLLTLLLAENNLYSQSLFGQMLFGNNYSYQLVDYIKNRHNEFIVLSQNNPGSPIRPSGCVLKIDSTGILLVAKNIIVDSNASQYVLRNIIQTSDDGYLLTAGYTSYNQKYLVIKTDSNFDVLWTKRYSRNYTYFTQPHFKAVELGDGGFVLFSDLYKSSYEGLPITKIDYTGNILWNKTIRDSSLATPWYDLIISCATSDGGFVLSGTCYYGVFIFKIDSLGNIKWMKKYNTSLLPNTIIEDVNRNLLITGASTHLSSTYLPFILRTDSNGNVINSKYIGLYEGSLNGIIELADSTFLVTGYSQTSANGPNSISVIKLDSDLDTIWTNNFKGNYGYGIFNNKNNILVITLCYYSGYDALVTFLQVDSSGQGLCNELNLINTVQSITIPSSDYAFTIAYDSIFVDSSVFIYSSPYLFTTIDYCNYYTAIEEPGNTNYAVDIFPNPFTNSATIRFNEEQNNTTIRIFDIMGKELKTAHFSGKLYMIEKGDMLPGVYIVQIADEKGDVINKKIIVQ